jgi:hypothetical protein
MKELTQFYQAGRGEGGFEGGIEAALQRMLADPQFIYRGEREPANMVAGKPYRITDLELASRLSFFFWSSIPDDELINVAGSGRLRDPAVLEQQVKRMLADPKSSALISNFTGQWLSVRGLKTFEPVVNLYPTTTTTCALPISGKSSSSSPASSRKIAASSICLTATTPSSTSGWPSITASRTSTARNSAGSRCRPRSTCAAG